MSVYALTLALLLSIKSHGNFFLSQTPCVLIRQVFLIAMIRTQRLCLKPKIAKVVAWRENCRVVFCGEARSFVRYGALLGEVPVMRTWHINENKASYYSTRGNRAKEEISLVGSI